MVTSHRAAVPWWWDLPLYKWWTRAKSRGAVCEANGWHRPVLIDSGMRKLCMRCLSW
jgi:hypothetical protein